MGLLVQLAGLLLRVAIAGFGVWIRLCVGVPTRVWWWIWRRPLPVWRRVHFAVFPWLMFGLAAAPYLFIEYLGRARPEATLGLRVAYAVAAPVAQVERQAIESVLGGATSFASPWEPSTEGGPRPATRARSRLPKMRPHVEVLARQFVVLLAGLLALPLAALLVFGGPILVPVLVVVRGRGGPTVSGRPLRNVSLRRFDDWRKKGDVRRTWFVGASATKPRCALARGRGELMHT
jgi:hypothetical protein